MQPVVRLRHRSTEPIEAIRATNQLPSRLTDKHLQATLRLATSSDIMPNAEVIVSTKTLSAQQSKLRPIKLSWHKYYSIVVV